METTRKDLPCEYEMQANSFLESHDITFKAVFLYNGKHFEDDKEPRDIYECTFERPGKQPFSIRFGHSLACSKPAKAEENRAYNKYGQLGYGYLRIKNRRIAPTAYGVLACLTKYSPGTFKEFCDDFGYDTDSIKAEKTYKAVCEEWFVVEKFFTSAELIELAEIQ